MKTLIIQTKLKTKKKRNPTNMKIKAIIIVNIKKVIIITFK